jgi:hypothetical protein
MTLEEAIDRFEGTFRMVRKGQPMSVCETGQVYDTLCTGGVKAENEEMPCYCTSEAGAIALWLSAAMEYRAGRGQYLYWRHEPEIGEMPLFRDVSAETVGRVRRIAAPVYAVYSRLCVSDVLVEEKAA